MIVNGGALKHDPIAVSLPPTIRAACELGRKPFRVGYTDREIVAVQTCPLRVEINPFTGRGIFDVMSNIITVAW